MLGCRLFEGNQYWFLLAWTVVRIKRFIREYIMSLAGLGCDVIEIERVRNSFESSPRFAARIFTVRELEYCCSRKAKYQHLAGRFAAKEAIGKAIGCPLSWLDVEIINNELGKPSVVLYGNAKEIAGHYKISISISHSQDYAMAIAVMEEEL